MVKMDACPPDGGLCTGFDPGVGSVMIGVVYFFFVPLLIVVMAIYYLVKLIRNR